MYKSEVIDFFKTKTALAKALGITPGAITQWKEIIPEKQAYRLMHLTDGALKINRTLYEKNSCEIKE